MQNRIKYVVCTILLLVAFLAAGQDRRIDERLDRYEYLCAQCMDIKSKAAAGENVSRSVIESLIDSFLAHNKDLKDCEGEMTATQRHRFAEIGKWFSTGTKPRTFTDLPSMPDTLLSSLVLSIPAPESFIADVGSVGCRSVVCCSEAESAAGKSRGDVFILATFAAPDYSYGLMVGYVPKRVGAYVGFRSNFVAEDTSYSCNSDGTLSSGWIIWPSGQQCQSNLAITGGLLINTTSWLAFQIGAGYGYRKMSWEDIDGQWALVSDWSHSGFAAECGALLSWRNLALYAGVSTVAFRTATFTCGLGVRF